MTTMRRTRAVEIKGLPAIPGLVSRHFGDAADYASMADVICAANTADGIPYLPTTENVRVDLDTADGADPVDDVVLVELAGRVVAFAEIQRRLRDDVPTYEMWGAVDPDHRRRGLGTALMGWTLERARVRASREDPGVAVDLGAFSNDTETGHQALLDAVGFTPVRHFFLMRRTGLDEIPDSPLPDGIEVRPVLEEHWRAILAAENEAFRDHWGHHEMTESAYQSTYSRSELDTSLWVVAWDGDEIAGVVQNWIWPEENVRLGTRRGWLEHISVRRPWRRRGLGRAITAASLVKFREVGMDEGMLGVDSENPNGALGLYEGLGFELFTRGAAYRRPMDR